MTDHAAPNQPTNQPEALRRLYAPQPFPFHLVTLGCGADSDQARAVAAAIATATATESERADPSDPAMRASVQQGQPMFSVRAAPAGRRPRVATWFSGTGTMEAALRGEVESVHAVEFTPAYMQAYNKAHGTAFSTRSVNDIDPQEVRAAKPDLFHASPVCKNFSRAKNVRTVEQTDLDSAQSVARVIAGARPPAVTIENDPDYIDTVPYKKITAALDAAGYRWDVGVYDAADYGGVQHRARMLIRAVREGELPPLPEKTQPGDWYEAIKDLIPGAPDDAFASRGSAENWEIARIRKMVDRGALDGKRPILTMGGSAYAGQANARSAGGPAPVLKSTSREVPRILLPDGKVKRVTPRMMARLMGLPDSFSIPSEPRLAKEVLGNGMQAAFTRALIQPLLEREAVTP
jgi:site-specific DNA-cytosine methylase